MDVYLKFLEALIPTPQTVAYLLAMLVGLYVQFLLSLKNGRTSETTFVDYWAKETPGASVATGIALILAAGATIKSGALVAMDPWMIVQAGAMTGFTLDASIQFPSPSAAAAPAAQAAKPAQAGFVRLELLAVLLISMLAGCAALGLATPKTPTQDLAYAVSVHEGLTNGLNNAVLTGAVTPAEGQRVESYLIQARVGLGAARVSLDGCTVKGQPIATVQAVVPTQAPGPLATVGALALQTVTCTPKTTALDQLILVNSLLQQLSAYYATKGIKTGQ